MTMMRYEIYSLVDLIVPRSYKLSLLHLELLVTRKLKETRYATTTKMMINYLQMLATNKLSSGRSAFEVPKMKSSLRIFEEKLPPPPCSFTNPSFELAIGSNL